MPPSAEFCGSCGEDLAFQDETQSATTRIAAVPRPAMAPSASGDQWAEVLLRVVGLFVIVGLGLAAGVLLFLWILGFFGRHPSDTADIGNAVVGGLAAIVALVFALLIGVVLAAVGGQYAAAHSGDRGSAVFAAGVGAAVGHFLLIVCLAGVLYVGIDLQTPSAPAATPHPSSDAASCRATFGADSPFCNDETASSGSAPIDYGALAKGAAGVVPAGLVGALVAAALFDRRRSDEGR